MVNWGFLTALSRLPDLVRSLKCDVLLEDIAISVRWNYEATHHRYSVDVAVRNGGSHAVTLESLHVDSPPGSSLREDPPLLFYRLGDDTAAIRESMLGPAVKVIAIGNELSNGSKDSFAFVFIPPEGWRGGEFKARLNIKIHTAREISRAIKIVQNLSPRED